MATGPSRSRKNHHRSGFGTSIPDRETQYDQVEGPFASMAPIPVNRRNPRVQRPDAKMVDPRQQCPNCAGWGYTGKKTSNTCADCGGSGLVAPMYPARARNNMAFRFTDGQGNVHEADTVEEYQALMKAFGGGRAPSPRVQTQQFRAELPPLRAPAVKRPKRAFQLDPAKVGAPVSPPQGAIIQAAVGGTASFCPPGVQGSGKLGQVTGADALNALGLTYERASAIISRFKAHGLSGKGPEQIAAAREILRETGRISFEDTRRNPSKSPQTSTWSVGIWDETGEEGADPIHIEMVEARSEAEAERKALLQIGRKTRLGLYLQATQFRDNPRRNPKPGVIDGCWGPGSRVARPNPAVPRGPNIVQLMGEDGEEWANYAQDRAGVAHRNPRKRKK